MVISGVNTVTYNGDGITTAWPFTFPVTDDGEIRVQLNNADGTAVIIESDYYVDLINSTVYYPGYAPGSEPPEAEQPPKVQEGQTITVYREIPITQESNLGDTWPFYVIEKGLDKLTMIAQQIDSGTKRTIDNALASMEMLADVVIDSDELQHITDQFNAIDANAAAAAESEENAAASATAAANSATAANTSAENADNTADALINFLETKETLTAPAVDPTLVISGAAADAKVTGDKIAEIDSAVGITKPSFQSIDGKYIGTDSLEKSSYGFSRSEPIIVSKDDIVLFTATGQSAVVSMISTSNAEGTTFVTKVLSTDSSEHTYTYTVEEDGYVVLSYLRSAGYELTILTSKSNESLYKSIENLYDKGALNLLRDAMLTVTADNVSATMSDTGHYIGKSGSYSASGAFNISSSITLPKNSMIFFNAQGYNDSVAVLAKVDNGTYTPLIVSTDSNEHHFNYVTLEDITVVISTNKLVSPIYSIFSSRIDSNDARISVLEQKDHVAFATMGVIGDSLACGSSNYTDGVSSRPLYSWGKFIEREHGLAVKLFSSGGATTRTWLSQSWGLTALNSADVLDCYIIGLGVNDAYFLGDAYLGSVADVHVGNESANADTYYGNYSKIIAAIKNKSPRAKIFCITNPKGTTSTGIAYNNAVETIVGLYTNTYLVDLRTDSFYTSKEFNDTWYAAHSTALGYKMISQNLYKHLNDIIKNNISDFTDIQWIIDNHA